MLARLNLTGVADNGAVVLAEDGVAARQDLPRIEIVEAALADEQAAGTRGLGTGEGGKQLGGDVLKTACLVGGEQG